MRLLALLSVATGLAVPPFHGTAAPVTGPRPSWHTGCPVPLTGLRLLTLDYWGFDGRPHEGQLIVSAAQTRNVLAAMRSLYQVRYPIRRMRLVDAYGADDRRSMAADNTSAFNCRPVSGTSRWSAHAYGLAIDINPVENPWVVGADVSPPAGRRFADRSGRSRGVIHAGDAVVRAFAGVGWRWGGTWRGEKDYQHFSATGH